MKTRNGTIDLLKFLFALALIIYHGRLISQTDNPIFSMGYFAVEFFFMVSGFFMAKTAIEKEKNSGRFLFEKYKGFMPYHIFAFLLAFIVTCVINSHDSLKSVIRLGISAVPEFLMIPTLSGIGFNLSSINAIEWYLSAMLVAMAILYPMVKKWKEGFCGIASLLIFLITSGYLYNTNGQTYNCIDTWNGYVCLGLLRAVADIAMGCFIYGITRNEPKKPDTRCKRIFITAAEIVCYGVVFFFMTSSLEKKYEFAVIYFLIAGISLSMTKRSYLAGVFNNKFVAFLGKLSFPMFLNQGWIRKLLRAYNPGLSYLWSELIFLTATIIVSLICIFTVDKILELIKSKKQTA